MRIFVGVNIGNKLMVLDRPAVDLIFHYVYLENNPMTPATFNKIFFIAFLISIFYCHSVGAQTAKQIIVFSNQGKAKGKVYVAFYNKEADFLRKDKIFLEKTVEINARGTVSISFENMTPGTYAIAAFLDENGNGKMDTNFLGFPKEKYGFSNNARPMMRAATFKEASFAVSNKENTINIKLK
jgi:uncharacterized protein (DUF2141 family)